MHVGEGCGHEETPTHQAWEGEGGRSTGSRRCPYLCNKQGAWENQYHTRYRHAVHFSNARARNLNLNIIPPAQYRHGHITIQPLVKCRSEVYTPSSSHCCFIPVAKKNVRCLGTTVLIRGLVGGFTGKD
jgi:hypothetical protein